MRCSALLFVALAGCFQSEEPPHDAAPDVRPPPRDAPIDAPPTDAEIIDCLYDELFPTFDRRCDSDADCILVLHAYDCAGSLRGLGIAAPEREHFDRAEATCRSMRPDCGIPVGPSMAEDGCGCESGSSYDTSCFRAACLEGACQSFVPGGCMP